MDLTELKLLSREQTAEQLGLSVRKIDYLRASGELPCIKMGGRTSFCRQDIDAFIQKNRSTPHKPQDDTELIKRIGWNLLPIGVAAIVTWLLPK
jgi:hypothetical protein